MYRLFEPLDAPEPLRPMSFQVYVVFGAVLVVVVLPVVEPAPVPLKLVPAVLLSLTAAEVAVINKISLGVYTVAVGVAPAVPPVEDPYDVFPVLSDIARTGCRGLLVGCFKTQGGMSSY